MRKLSFETDDKLGRLEYAKFLKTIILNSDQYKRDLLTNAYTIAVDSPWGTGKSYFFNMFMNYCEDIDDLKVIYYNAWENDFWDNPFDPFMNTILEDGIFQLQIDNKNAANLGSKFLTAAKNIACGFARAKIEKQFNIAIPSDLETLEELKGYLKGENSFFGEYKLFRKNIIEMKEIMTTYMDASKRKLVIIVDELDRCKPNFAIQTLEIVKHLFDVKDMVFVFAVDISQLSCSIKTVYGQDMDSTGYLCRFFDYISKIPQTDSTRFIRESLNNIECISQIDDKINFVEKMEMFFTKMQVYFGLTLRDLDTVLKSYNIMLDIFLKNYKVILAHYNYIFLMIMKFKNIDLYNSIFYKHDKEARVKEVASLREKLKEYLGLANVLKNVNNIINDLLLQKNDSVGNLFGNEFIILEVKDRKLYYEQNQSKYYTEIETSDGLSLILFEPDLKIYNSIYKITYGNYICQKLEMFNFVNESND